MTVQAEIEALVDRYLTAWNARDFDGMATLFTEPTVYMLADRPLCLPDRAALIEVLKKRFAAMEADGFDHTEIAAVRARQCNDTTAMVDLKQVERLRADGSALEVIDAIYVCLKQADGWRFSIAIGCWPNWQEPSQGDRNE